MGTHHVGHGSPKPRGGRRSCSCGCRAGRAGVHVVQPSTSTSPWCSASVCRGRSGVSTRLLKQPRVDFRLQLPAGSEVKRRNSKVTREGSAAPQSRRRDANTRTYSLRGSCAIFIDTTTDELACAECICTHSGATSSWLQAAFLCPRALSVSLFSSTHPRGPAPHVPQRPSRSPCVCRVSCSSVAGFRALLIVGGLAHMVERVLRKHEAKGSIPLSSILLTEARCSWRRSGAHSAGGHRGSSSSETQSPTHMYTTAPRQHTHKRYPKANSKAVQCGTGPVPQR